MDFQDWLTLGVDVANNIGTNIMSERLNKQAREWQEEMWNKQNEYNLPINQRKRLEEAGINPNLAFGSSASASGTSVPGSPASHGMQMNLGEFYLRKKQIEAQVKAQNASTEREQMMTEQLRMSNEIMAQLMNDTIVTKRGDMYVQRIIQGWKEDNLRDELDLSLETDRQKLDVLNAEEALRIAQTDYSKQSLENLKQTYDHMVYKYGYEDYYYFNEWNPYETSTPIGIMRYVIGTMHNILKQFGYK